jgi:putative flippase GtrA
MVTLEQRIRTAPSFVRFALVGLIATVVDFTLFNAALAGQYEPTTYHLLLAATSGFTVATYVSYQLNARFTFRANRDNRALGRYFTIAVVGVLIHNGALLLLRSALDPETFIELNAVKAGALSASMLWNYVGYRQFAFRRR